MSELIGSGRFLQRPERSPHLMIQTFNRNFTLTPIPTLARLCHSGELPSKRKADILGFITLVNQILEAKQHGNDASDLERK